jgi:hypothetical protein
MNVFGGAYYRRFWWVFWGTSVEKRTLRRHMCKWEDNIEMDLAINKIWTFIGLIWFIRWAAVNAVCTFL